MHAFEERLRVIAQRTRIHSSAMATEEAVKTSIVLPFLHALGYDVFDPLEVVPEFTADAVGKKGEKVDYAISLNGRIQILIECKPISTALELKHLSQLFRYFTVTTAKFAVLTNGRLFQFYTDLEEANKLDPQPFLTIDLADLQPNLLGELKKFEKAAFDVENILATAERLKYTFAIKQAIHDIIESPSEAFVKMVAANAYHGKMTVGIRDMLSALVKTAFKEILRDNLQASLASALASTEVQAEAPMETTVEDEIVTTEEEIEGYMVIKAIVREVIQPARIFMRDAKSYCAILIDNNNRKPLARMHFNRSIKYVGLFDGETEEKIRITSIDDIFAFGERLRASAKRYVDQT
jgi:predicted type IV restriction endonuclease